MVSVFTTYLIVNVITDNNSHLGPDIDAGRGVLPIAPQPGLLEFEYPVFLDKVPQRDPSEQPFVEITAISSDLLQALAM
ncbi:MAG: hypothetical protein ACI9C4_002601 [Paraglaciecola sp.]